MRRLMGQQVSYYLITIKRDSNSISDEQGATAQPQTRAAVATPPPALHTSVENPATGITVNDTTMPPREGVKYVCCGGCRQWLLAPRDAVYVACGTCQAINNCNLAQNNRVSFVCDIFCFFLWYFCCSKLWMLRLEPSLRPLLVAFPGFWSASKVSSSQSIASLVQII